MEQKTHDKISLLLYLGDTNHILSQRNAEWCGHGPVLEQDIALTNITLDLLGQARMFYQYAAELLGNTHEDQLAYHRGEREYLNLLLVEQPKGDWAQTILKQFFFSVFANLYYKELLKLEDDQITAICNKALKEVAYHIRWSGEWVIRLGDGTKESNQRMQRAIGELYSYTGEMFTPAKFEKGLNIDCDGLLKNWKQSVQKVLDEATLQLPEEVYMQLGGKDGLHTENLGFILAEMQHLQRAMPGLEW